MTVRYQQVFVGVDPGTKGGAALVTPDGDLFEVLKFADATDRDILDTFIRWGRMGIEPWAMIEKVNAMPARSKDGTRRVGTKSMFVFGEGYGKLQMALMAAGMWIERVTPSVWQKAMACRTGGDKNISKARAQELFPGAHVTHAVADAMLIAEYCRRTRLLASLA